jgi:hypothetical protein
MYFITAGKLEVRQYGGVQGGAAGVGADAGGTDSSTGELQHKPQARFGEFGEKHLDEEAAPPALKGHKYACRLFWILHLVCSLRSCSRQGRSQLPAWLHCTFRPPSPTHLAPPLPRLKIKHKESPIGHHHGHDHTGGDPALHEKQQQQQKQKQKHPHKQQKHGGRKDLYKAWKYINGLGEDFRCAAILRLQPAAC